MKLFKTKLNSQGVAHLITIFIVILAVVIGGAGYYVYQANKGSTTANAGSSCVYREFSYGSTSQCVKYIQTIANAMSANKRWCVSNASGYQSAISWGYKLTVDGKYGANTKTVITDMQNWWNRYTAFPKNQYACMPDNSEPRISADGVVGLQGWSILCQYGAENKLTGAAYNAGKAAGCLSFTPVI